MSKTEKNMKIEIKKIEKMQHNGLFIIHEAYINNKRICEICNELRGDDIINLSSYSEQQVNDYFSSNIAARINNEKSKKLFYNIYFSLEEFEKAGWFYKLHNQVTGVIEDISNGFLSLEEDF